MARLLPHVQGAPGNIEDCPVGAHEDDGVAIVCAGEGHLDLGHGAGLGAEFDFVQVTEEPLPVGGNGQQGKALVSDLDVVGHSVGKGGDDHSDADLLVANADDGDWQGSGAVGGDKPSAYFHFLAPGKQGAIDWSPISSRRVVCHPENREVA